MTDQTLPTTPARPNNTRVALMCVGMVVAMGGMAYAAVPLYQLFCQVTGFGGTTQRADGNPRGVIDRVMTVRFDSNVDRDLSWTVTPSRPITDQIGTVETVNYVARNLTNRPISGTAVFNVTPDKAGIYFNKIECFCFTQQTLQPGEEVEMPVTFFVDPDLADNRELDTVREITLSYTFYASDNQGR
ncbi:cytochrome c oxidase assembly protein [Arsenicitalea aurantiaca]|uniref:Cytochrome c oxidase assembly protein CtaG n=1 Tax=Arsenicitalea aurantiaca TaxID=1783274 RepID=A0A433XAR0_9HYPH|nr:cytochrome c oxidase assembly protein [Arsenicitalea aurantiaca]RUT31177.1 cytochrome c oxidase assembly protein [Arsenicitalea aurantiaca]